MKNFSIRRLVESILVLTLFFISQNHILAQGKDCNSATVLTNLTNYCSADSFYSNNGFTDSSAYSAYCWGGKKGIISYFKFTAIATELTVTINGKGTKHGSLTAPYLSLIVGASCLQDFFGRYYISSSNQIACSKPTGNSTTLYRAGLTIGTTYYILMINDNPGTFQLCINNVAPPATTPGQDCITATRLCNKDTLKVNSIPGPGNFTNEAKGSCMGKNVDGTNYVEQHSTWYTWTAKNTGTLTFTITPTSSTDDLDFALCEFPTGSCATKNWLACDASSCNTSGNVQTGAPTGLNFTSTDVSEPPTDFTVGCNGSDGFVKYITMQQGHKYGLLIDNFSTTGGFILNWGGTGMFQDPVSTFTASDTTVCGIGTPVTFNNTTTFADSLLWNFGSDASIKTSSVNGPHTVSFSQAGTHIVSLTAFGLPCEDIKFKTIHVVDLNTSIASKVDAVCNTKGLATDSASVVGGNSNYTYSWNTTPSQTGRTATGLNPGTYSVTVSAGGCSKTSPVTIASSPNTLQAAASTASSVSCYGGSDAKAAATATFGTSAYTYSWSTSPVQTDVTATGLNAGSYALKVTDVNGCTATSNVTITQPPPLDPSFSSVVHVSCNGNNDGSSTVAVFGGISPYSYAWNTVPVQTNANATGLAPATYVVTVSDKNGCTKSASVTITEAPLLVPAVSSQTNVLCTNDKSGSAAVSATGGVSGYTVTWAAPLTQTGTTATGLAAGTYSATVTDSKGCSKTVSVTITEPSSVLSNAVVSSDVNCNGSATGSATATPAGGTSPYSFSWNTSPAQTNSSATNLAAGTYSVEVTDNNGCKTTSTAVITQPLPLNLDNVAATNVSCFGGSNGSANITPAGGFPIYSYSWSTSPSQTASNAVGLAAGDYAVTVTDSKGCTSTKSVSVKQPSGPLASVVSAAINITCGDSSGSATSSATAGTSPYTYVWNTTPAQTSSTAINLFAASYNVIVTDANGCTTSSSVTITKPTPLVASVSSNAVICQGQVTSITGSAANGTGPYHYSWSNGLTGAGPVNVSPVGTITYTVTVTDSCGATSSATVAVSVNPKPHAQFSASPVTANTDVPITFTDSSSLAASWNWNFGDGAFSNEVNPTHSYSSAGNFPVTLIVTSADGCKDTAVYHDIKIKKLIHIPNIFTPTGDGINDYFVILTSGVMEYYIDIYDRWGLKLFNSTSAAQHWDGRTPSGGLAPEGTYYFILSGKFTDGEPFQQQGFFTLMR